MSQGSTQGSTPKTSIPVSPAQDGPGDDVDYGHRHFVNLVSVAFVLVLAVAMVWTVKAIDAQELLRKCAASGRKDCVHIAAPAGGHRSGGALSALSRRRRPFPRLHSQHDDRRRDALRHARQQDRAAPCPVRPPQAPRLWHMDEGGQRRLGAQRGEQRLVAQVIARVDRGRAGRARGADRPRTARATGAREASAEARWARRAGVRPSFGRRPGAAR